MSWQRKTASVIVALALGAATAAHARERREVKQPHFGEALYQFFQEHHFSALTHLMTEQQFARLGAHADEAELLRGGLLLSYGVHTEAAHIFERLIEAGAEPATRDRAWFYLAKIRYQRGYIEQAEDAIARIQDALPADLEDERRLLQAYLLMQRQQYREAVEVLQRVPARSDLAAYGRYNVGVALIKAGERRAGERLLEELGTLPARGEEYAALKDKANVALAYVFLQEAQSARAKSYLERVRLDGLYSNKALLGMGWAHAAATEHERSLVPWTELAARPLADAAVQESLLAVPYAYGKLGAYRQSLTHYESALSAYTREIQSLDESIASIRAGRLVDNILRQNPTDEAGWFWRMQRPPDSPETRYLTQLLATHDFQEALKNYRDLRFLEHNLQQWAQSIGIYRDMVATRRLAFAERLPRVLAGDRRLDLAGARARRDAYAAELTRIERDGDAAAFANDKERALLDRLARTGRTLERHPDADARDKRRFLSGVLAWDLSEQFPERLWQAKKGVHDIDRALADAEQHRAALAQAQVEAPRSFDAFAGRIDGVRTRIAELQRRTELSARAQERHLAELAVEELARQRERIVTYITQARFAVAQIYDQAVRAQEATP